MADASRGVRSGSLFLVEPEQDKPSIRSAPQASLVRVVCDTSLTTAPPAPAPGSSQLNAALQLALYVSNEHAKRCGWSASLPVRLTPVPSHYMCVWRRIIAVVQPAGHVLLLLSSGHCLD